MRTRVLLFILFAMTLVSLGGLFAILFNTAPEGSNVLALFYASTFFLIFGLVFFVGYAINYYRYRALPPWQQTSAVFRYGAILGTLVVLNLLISVYVGYSTPLLIILIALGVFGEIVWRKKMSLNLP